MFRSSFPSISIFHLPSLPSSYFSAADPASFFSASDPKFFLFIIFLCFLSRQLKKSVFIIKKGSGFISSPIVDLHQNN